VGLNDSCLRGSRIKLKIILGLLLVASAGAAYYYFVYRASQAAPLEVAYVLPESLGVVDSPAQIRVGVAVLKQGDRVEVLERTKNWARVRMADGRAGWVEATDLLDATSFEKGQQLLKELARAQPQAAGHTVGAANLRLEPARDAPQLVQLPANQSVELFGRRLVERPPPPGAPAPSEPVRDAWYLVRAGSKAGWVLGRLVTLDVPEAIGMYAQSVNLVGWIVLNTVDDNGRPVPQYLVADRQGTGEFDFNHIRVFTWWTKKQDYVTAYVESKLNGYFPIRVTWVDGVPHFRLRLVDRYGRKVQKVYAIFDTIVRPVGTVEGWESDALPARPVSKARRPRAAARGGH
jgi:hypothetical protein